MERHIAITGTGIVGADPDRCRIDLRVSASSPSVEEATRSMSAAARAVLDALREAGAERVSTGRFAIRPDHDRHGRPVGFRSETAVSAAEMAEIPVEPGAQTTTVQVKATFEIA